MIIAFFTFLSAILLSRFLVARSASLTVGLASLAALAAGNAGIGFALGAVVAQRAGGDWIAAGQEGALHGGLLGLAVGGLAFMRRMTADTAQGEGPDALRALMPERPRRVNGRMVLEVEADHSAAPLNPLPWVVWLLALPMIGIEIVMNYGERGMGGNVGLGWRVDAVQTYAFSPDILRRMIEAHQYPLDGLVRLVSYPFLHGQITHTLFVVVILLALGKFVGEAFRWWAILVVFFAASIAGALAMTAVPSIHQPLLGGYPPVYGLIGAFTYLLWTRLAGTGAMQYRAFTMIGFLLLAQLLFGVLFGGGLEWVADLTGFVTGFALSFVVAPGGWAQVRDRLRQR